MVRRTFGVLAAVTPFVSGCAYPEFAFVVETDATPGVSDVSVAIDGAVEDARTPETSLIFETEPLDARKPCTSTFCSDFDGATSATAGWDESNVTSGLGTLALEASGRSGPNALLATASPHATGVVYASVQRNLELPSVNAIVDAEMWIKLESTTFAGEAAYLTKIARGGDGVALMMDATGLYVETPSQSFRITKPIAPGTWFWVRFAARIHTTNGSVQLFIDDPTTPVVSKSGFRTTYVDGLDRKFVIGIYASKGTSTFRARFDDVTMSIVP